MTVPRRRAHPGVRRSATHRTTTRSPRAMLLAVVRESGPPFRLLPRSPPPSSQTARPQCARATACWASVLRRCHPRQTAGPRRGASCPRHACLHRSQDTASATSATLGTRRQVVGGRSDEEAEKEQEEEEAGKEGEEEECPLLWGAWAHRSPHANIWPRPTFIACCCAPPDCPPILSARPVHPAAPPARFAKRGDVRLSACSARTSQDMSGDIARCPIVSEISSFRSKSSVSASHSSTAPPAPSRRQPRQATYPPVLLTATSRTSTRGIT